MFRCSLIVTSGVLATWLFASPTAAQSLNIDFQHPDSTYGTPSVAYGAAAGQAGVWNEVEVVSPIALRDVYGAPTPVQIVFPHISFWDTDSGQGATGEAGALVQDGLVLQPLTIDLEFQGLLPGAYRVYSFAANLSAEFSQSVVVEGHARTVDGYWPGSHVEGVDHVVHDATVDDSGLLRITSWVEELHDYVNFNGFQLVRVGDVGSILCQGDGTGPASCPCSNDSTVPGRGCLHSGGEGMRIRGTGSASLAADDLVLVADHCPMNNTGIFYVGETNLWPGTPLFDGLQCAGGNARRFQGQLQSAGTATDTGFVAQEPSGTYFVAGQTYVFQYFSRDVSGGPSPCGLSANFSPGLRVVYAP